MKSVHTMCASVALIHPSDTNEGDRTFQSRLFLLWHRHKFSINNTNSNQCAVITLLLHSEKSEPNINNVTSVTWRH